jgi:hypothetical protein
MSDATGRDGTRASRSVRLGQAVVVSLLTLGIQLPFFDRWFSVMDEGHMLLFADLVRHGQQLYSDMTIYPLPGAFYLLSAAFELFGPSIRVSRWLVSIEFALLVGISFALLRRIVSLPYAGLAVFALWVYRVWAFPHWQIYNYSSTALLLLFGALATLVAFFESRNVKTLWAAGLLYGLGVFCKQDYGAAVGLTALGVLVVHGSSRTQRLRELGHFFGPAAAVGALAGLHFFAQGQLGFVVQMTVLKHFVGLSSYEYHAFPPLLPLFSPDPALRDNAGIFSFFPAIVFSVDNEVLQSEWFRQTPAYELGAKTFIYGPIPLVIWGLIRSVWRRDRRNDASLRVGYLAETTLSGFAASVVALAHLYRPQDYVHLAVLYWPLVLLVIAMLHSGLSGRRRATALVSLLLIVPAAATTAYTLRLVSKVRSDFDEPLDGPRAGVFARPEQVMLFRELVTYMRANSAPGEAIGVLPYFSIAHFLADRHGPHAASYIVWPFPEYPDRDQRIVDAMEAKSTDTVIYTHTHFPTFPAVAEYAPVLFDYLVENFQTDRTFADGPLGFKVSALRRTEEPAAGRVLDATEGRLARESANGRRTPIGANQVDRHWARTIWPFRPVWAVRPSLNGRTVLSVPVDVPDNAALSTAVGVHPDAWWDYPNSSVRFSIEVVDGPERTVLFERTLSPHTEMSDRGWFDAEVSLASFAGRRVALEFATSTDMVTGQHLDMGGFAAPRIRTGSAP